ncbi:MAG: histidine kinase, partial [Methanomicrobia archaeon]|nr:histidine kinase [Methanomicrobia archaeon]
MAKSLRKKTLIIIGITIVCLIVILYGVSQVLLLHSFDKLEEQNTRQNVERVTNALSHEFSQLDTTTYDWAAWDDTYAFIEDRNEEYIASNLIDGTFADLELN